MSPKVHPALGTSSEGAQRCPASSGSTAGARRWRLGAQCAAENVDHRFRQVLGVAPLPSTCCARHCLRRAGTHRPPPVHATSVVVLGGAADPYLLRLPGNSFPRAFPAVKSLDTFDFPSIPSVNKALAMELARCEYIQRSENVIAVTATVPVYRSTSRKQCGT